MGRLKVELLNKLLDNELEQKKRFASAWLYHPSDPYRAACAVFGDDISKALIASRDWITDTFVLSLMEKASDRESFEALPDKEQTARMILGRAQRAFQDTDCEKLFRLFCDVMGYTPKAKVHVGDNIQNNSITQILNEIDGTSRGLPAICRDNEESVQTVERALPH